MLSTNILNSIASAFPLNSVAYVAVTCLYIYMNENMNGTHYAVDL